MAGDKDMARARGQPDDPAACDKYPFHYGLEADSYTFYRVPKLLFSEPEFAVLSTDAKMLYGLLIDRMQLSARNNWVDDSGRIYIYFKIESIMQALSCGNKKACAILAELDDRKGIGLVSRVKQGMGRPDRIYVHKCISEEKSKRHFMTCHNDTSYDVENTSHDMSKSHRNNTEKNNTENINTESILSDQVRVHYRSYFESALSMDALRHDYPMRIDTLNEILDLIVDTCSSRQKHIWIAGDSKPEGAVREAFMQLTDSHIRYVLECMDETAGKIRNIRQYLLAALYNSTMTISNYYEAEVRHDLNGKGGVDDRCMKK